MKELILSNSITSNILIVAVGFCSGIISGLGIGGGAILIPAILFLSDISQQQAQGINLIFFLPTAIMAIFIHNKSNLILWDKTKKIASYGLIGAILGSLLAINIEPNLLKKIFAGFLFIMGLKEVLVKNKT